MKTTDGHQRDNRLPEERPVGFLRALAGYLMGGFLIFATFIMALIIDVDLNSFFNNEESISRHLVLLTTILGVVTFTVAMKSVKFAGAARAGGVFIAIGAIIFGAALYSTFANWVDRPQIFVPVTAFVGIMLLITGFINRRRYREVGLVGIQGPSFWGMSNKTARLLRDSKFSDNFQIPLVRRLVVTVYVVFLIALGFTYALDVQQDDTWLEPGPGFIEGFADGFKGVETETPKEKQVSEGTNIKDDESRAGGSHNRVLGVFILIGIVVLSIILDQALFMCLKPVIALKGEALDERQNALVQSANADARIVSLGVIASIALLAFSRLAPVSIGILALMGGALTYITPHIILAWNLPAESEYEDDDMLIEEGA